MSAESTSFVIDGSHSIIKNKEYNRIIKYLEFTLLEKAKKGRKTDSVSVFLSNSIESHNEEELDDIFTFCTCEAPVTTTLYIDIIKKLRRFNSVDDFRPIDENGHSIIRTVLISNMKMRSVFGKRKMLKQIMVFSDNWNELKMDDDELELLIDQLNDTRLILVTCSETIGKDDIKNIDSWRRVIQALKTPPMVFSLDELISRIQKPIASVVKPVRVFGGQLRMGANIETIMSESNEVLDEAHRDDRCICIRVEGFPATKSVASLSKKLVSKEANAKDVFMPVKSVIEYEINQEKRKDGENDDTNEREKGEDEDDRDDNSNNNKLPVSVKHVTKAYRYGSDYVVLPPTIMDSISYRTYPGLDIRGFLTRETLPRYYLNSESVFILADTRNGTLADSMSLYALVDAMLKHDKVAIARYVNKRHCDVQMCVLVPHLISTKNVGDEYFGKESLDDDGNIVREPVRAFILNRLPFAEDERNSVFPLLDKHETTSTGNAANTVKSERKKDTKEDIDELMSEYIDSMDTDSLGNIPNELYYHHISETMRDTTIPLPDDHQDDDEDKVREKQDPLNIPSISIYQENQRIFEWIHQLKIEERETFRRPELPEDLQAKISPYTNQSQEMSEERMKKLVELLSVERVGDEGALGGKKGVGRIKTDVESMEASQMGLPIEDYLNLVPKKAKVGQENDAK